MNKYLVIYEIEHKSVKPYHMCFNDLIASCKEDAKLLAKQYAASANMVPIKLVSIEKTD